MIRFGIIGTNWISGDFVKAIKSNKECSVTAVYSRKEETGNNFIKEYNLKAKVFTSLEEMAKSEEVDAVYVGSPNSLHGSQSFICLQNNKHVICEKPITTNLEDFDKNVLEAKRNGLTYMEAVKTSFLPNIEAIKKNIYKIGKVRNIVLNYSQYSSRYDALKRWELTNVFDPKFDGGSTFDLGIYPLYFIMSIFGLPESYIGRNIFLESRIDGTGVIVLNYEDMIATLIHSKITATNVPSEILGEEGTIVIDGVSVLKKVTIIMRDGKKEEITMPQELNQMTYELEEFVSLIKNNRTESEINNFKLSRKSVEILSAVRKN